MTAVGLQPPSLFPSWREKSFLTNLSLEAAMAAECSCDIADTLRTQWHVQKAVTLGQAVVQMFQQHNRLLADIACWQSSAAGSCASGTQLRLLHPASSRFLSDKHVSLLPLQEAAVLGRPLFSLFSHAAARVQDCAALIMRAVAQGGASAAAPMREAALKEGAMLHHLLTATSGQVNQKAKLQGLLKCSMQKRQQ